MFQRILVPLDGSPLAERALAHAAALARPFRAEVVVLHVAEPDRRRGGGVVDAFEWGFRRAESLAYVEARAQVLRNRGTDARAVVDEGPAAQRILENVVAQDADLVVLSSHGEGGVSEFPAAGTAQKVLGRVPVSVLLVPAHAPPPRGDSLAYRGILVPLDCSRRAESAVRVAAQLARMVAAELLLVHSVQVPELTGQLPPEDEALALRASLVRRNRAAAERYLVETRPRFAGPDLSVRTLVTECNDVAHELREVVRRERPDLVVACAHGAGGSTQWPCGGIVQRLLGSLDVPLLVYQDTPAPRRAPSSRPAAVAAPERMRATSRCD